MKRDFYIIDINPSEIKFIEKNARFMSQNEFNALVSNIKRDGQLSSVPFLIKENEIYTVISGNHRIKASIEAGLTSIKAMVGENLSNDEIRAIQLSHNSITGKKYDVVCCFETLEHILEDRSAAIFEMFRILKPGGVFVGTIPIPGRCHPKDDPTVLFISPDELTTELKKYSDNFKIEETGSIKKNEVPTSWFFCAYKRKEL